MLQSERIDAPEAAAPWIPTFASVLAAAIAAALLCPAPQASPRNPADALLWAVLFVCAIGGVTAVAARVSVAAFCPSVADRAGPTALAFAGNGVWFAPLAIFVAHDRSWSFLGAALLGVATARLLRRCDDGFDDDELEGLRPGDGLMFASWVPAGSPRRTLRAFAAALAIETGGLVEAMGKTAFSALLAGVGCFLVACSTATVARTPREHSVWRPGTDFAVPALCSIALATLGLVRIPGFSETRDEVRRNAEPSSSRVGMAREVLLSGAILLPNMSRYVKLVAPVPSQRAELTLNRTAPPTSIEFSGEYWIFLSPLHRPPKSSMVERGTPITYTFTAVDRSPLIMQARQRLRTPIDPRCCSAIHVAVRNADKQPETISLQVTLATSTLRGPRQQLGVRDLPTTESAVLSFPMPARSVIPQFDEIIVEFQLHSPRMNRSANVSVQRFLLTPRRR